MHRTLLALVVAFCAEVAHSQDLKPAQTDISEKPYARVPREIAFQNDSQWEDNRWQQTEIGPFLAGTIQTPKGLTLKGLAVRVGAEGQATVCYDTARCRMSGAWIGGFLRFDARRFGVIRHPVADGALVLSTQRQAGWARDGKFTTDQGNQITRLPEEWISFHGHYTHNDRVVLAYSVGNVRVLESPWYVAAENAATTTSGGFVRSLEIDPSSRAMQMWIADAPTHATVIDSTGDVELTSQGRVLEIKPHKETVRVKLLLADRRYSLDALVAAAGPLENLSQWIQSDRGRFPETLTTRGVTTETGGPYVVDTLTLPFENPWNALLFTAGHDFFSNGTAAVCTLHGDVWTVSGIDRNLQQLRWRRFATGLSQPLGLKIIDDRVYVINRTQLTRLHDQNGDGEADHYECFNNDNSTTPGSHDFVTCLETDPDGNLYYIHARTGVMKISADGKQSESVADGFRNPNGMGVSPQGTITAAPQQGQWTPQSSLIVVRDGGYYGYGGPRVTPERPTGWDLPMCFIPHTMDNSGGGQVWVDSQRWGPLSGRMLHLSYGQCRMLLVVEEQSSELGSFQGGTIEFPMNPGDFQSGAMRGRFSPHDGQLYVSGLRGWQTRAIRDGCFQRVRYTGGPIHLPTAVKTLRNGIQISFTESLDPEAATDPGNYFVSEWNYLWSAAYGSPEFSVERPGEQGRDEVSVLSATLLPDGKSVFLEMPPRHPVNQLVIDFALKSARGAPVRGKYAHTINVDPVESFPEAKIDRRVRAASVAPEIVARLKPGLSAQVTSVASGESDVRILRLAAARDAVDASPTVFLPPGPFTSEITGTIKTPLSGDYTFRFDGSGEVELSVHGETVLQWPKTENVSGLKTENVSGLVRLQKGHNPIRIRYRSPATGTAHWKLWWKGFGFGWEPVPPDAVFHDGEVEAVMIAAERRHGRSLVARHRCVQCHRTELGPDSMLETTLAAPELGRVAGRLKRDWMEQWLLDPASVHSDPSMPSLLPEDATVDAANIVAFLMAMDTGREAPELDPGESRELSSGSSGEPADGEALFESLGCVACHHFDAIEVDELGAGRLSLHFAAAKYREGAIAELILDPDAHHAATGMPDFSLQYDAAGDLERYIRQQSRGTIAARGHTGSVADGIAAVAKYGCQQCHALGSGSAVRRASRPWKLNALDRGCLASTEASRASAPRFDLTESQRDSITRFVSGSLASLQRSHPAETAARIVGSLRCAACHDRDGLRSARPRIIAEEGSGRLPEPIPALTWLGEKFHSDWNQRLFSGQLKEKPRPWLSARMPAFPQYANALATGLAIEHAVDPDASIDHSFDAELAKVGERLTRETGLDCRQCHAVGDQQPRGDAKTQIALGINFTIIRERMRKSSYHRFMLDPPRYDINTKMIKLSEDGVTTKLKSIYDQDANKQFEAVWHYIQSLQP